MKKSLIYGLIFIVGLFVILSLSGVIKLPFSVVSISNVPVQSDDVYWTASINSNQVQEGVGFSFVPKSTTLTQVVGSYPYGTTVSPKDSVTLEFDNAGSACTYTMIAVTKPTTLFGLPTNIPDLKYFELGSPVRSMNVNVCANGNCQKIDATQINLPPIVFYANGGTLKVAPQGALIGAQDCPNNANVAVYKTSTNQYIYYNEASLLDSYKTFKTIYTNMDNLVSNSLRANVFTTGFGANIPTVNSLGTPVVVGAMPINLLGSGNFLITGSSKYFNSVFVVPPTSCTPTITSLSVNDIQQGTSGTASVSVKSDVPCTVSLQATSQRSSINPSVITISSTTNPQQSIYTISANSATGGDSITVRACNSNIYGGATTCDTKTTVFNVVTKSSSGYCGDGSCDSSIGENSATCSKDCSVTPVPNPTPSSLDCTKYSTWLVPSRPATSTGQSCVLGFIACHPIVTNTCGSDYTLVVILIIVVIVSLIIVYLMRRKK